MTWNVPDDWNSYNRTCDNGHVYHLSEYGCDRCCATCGEALERDECPCCIAPHRRAFKDAERYLGDIMLRFPLALDGWIEGQCELSDEDDESRIGSLRNALHWVTMAKANDKARALLARELAGELLKGTP